MQEHVGEESPDFVAPRRVEYEWRVQWHPGNGRGRYTATALFGSVRHEDTDLETSKKKNESKNMLR